MKKMTRAQTTLAFLLASTSTLAAAAPQGTAKFVKMTTKFKGPEQVFSDNHYFADSEGAMKACYDELLRTDATAAGTGTFLLEMNKEGKVLNVTADEKTLAPKMIACAKMRFMTWKSYRQHEKTVKATYDFSFAGAPAPVAAAAAPAPAAPAPAPAAAKAAPATAAAPAALTDFRAIAGWPGWKCADYKDGRDASSWYKEEKGAASAKDFKGNCDKWKK